MGSRQDPSPYWQDPRVETDQDKSLPFVTSCRGEQFSKIPRRRCGRSGVPTHRQGIKVLGCPLGHEDFVTTQLEAIGRKHQKLLQAIPTVPDVQSAWLLLLHSASTWANFYLRVIRPEFSLQFARGHDARLWQCLSRILGLPENFCGEITRHAATLPIGQVGPTRCR